MRDFDIDEMLMFTMATVLILALAGLTFLGFTAMTYELSGTNCYGSARMKGLEYNYSWSTGCMVNYNSTWVKDSVLVPVEDANGNIKYVPNTKIRIIQEIKQ